MEVEEVEEVVKSSRDLEKLRKRLEGWLQTRLPERSHLALGEVSSPSATGMSSETLLFDARWRGEGGVGEQSYVARIAPSEADVPVFRHYDLEKQFRAMELVARASDVPVPPVCWLESDVEILGAPFFIMERVEGRVPPDIMPYPFGSWLKDASKEEQRELQDATIEVLASLHGIELGKYDTDFLELPTPGNTPLRRVVADWREMYDWMREGRRFPLLEDGFAWLDANWPAEEGETVLTWGDARIGNILYDGFRPAAVLDWEMVGVGPRGLDVGWCIFLHAFFQDLAGMAGIEGMPDFLRREDVVAEYERLTGTRLTDLHWYETFTALRHGIIMARIHARRVHFEGADWPVDLDEVIPHKALLASMIDVQQS